jgi:cholesterol oxidase
VKPFQDPLSSLTTLRRAASAPPKTPAIGLAFHEEMTGTWAPPGAEPRNVDCHLCVTITDVAQFLARPEHVGIVTGTVQVDGLTDGPVPVQHGVWNLFVASASGPSKEIRYSLSFHGRDGTLHGLHGVKVFAPRAGLEVWDESTTLDFRLHAGADRRRPPIGHGTLKLGLLGALELAGSIEVLGPYGVLDSTRAKADFLGFFFGTLKDLELG